MQKKDSLTVNKANLKNLFRKRLKLYRESRLRRLLKDPQRLIYLKFIEIIARVFKKTIRVKTKTFWGDDMFLVVPEPSIFIYRFGFFEEGLTAMLLEYLEPNMTFFDIGAHFGYYSLLASCIVGDKGRVHSFEPTPSTFTILKENVSRKNIVVNNLAVFSRRQFVVLHDYGIEYSGINSIYSPKLPEDIVLKLKQPKEYRIEAISIDEYVENNGIQPDFVKIDAESAEYEILKGMEKTIKDFHPIISIEVGDYGVEGVPTSAELINFLISKGYQPYEYRMGEIVSHALRESYEYDNILFLPG